ncbi:ABC transporter ATP-binding protein [Variovorax sp. RA8]|uniref:ABC transporter ATP-binding protein n=1 Tax=Variovorax sp. (strain JCM 16519 / RA8) TaxID=662548 RepID=UPI000AB89167|nr:ABC transporter ATP-binding protein [Variovorax sp. RA8]VTU21856.1 Lipoprotein-releasing system ATP-binding protein LolD [Variovorax sp. RA8]
MSSAEPGAGPVIRVEHVTRTLEGEVPVTLVEDVSLEIDRGEFVCVMGPSGSGKSSLLYLLGLLDVPTQGRIWIDGQDTSAFDEDRLADFRLARLGYVFQFHFLLPEFSALDNVSLPIRKLGRLSDREAVARASELLDQFGLEGHHRKKPSQLSGGQRQRVAIARALANDPLVILADEPTGNLDSVASTNVRDILRSLTRELHKSVVAVTHDTDFASVADRRIGIVDGRIDMAWRPNPGV